MLNYRIETEPEVNLYLANLKYALNHGADIQFQIDRRVDEQRELKYTNRHTVALLFPSEYPKDAMRRELQTLTVRNYIRTVKDLRYLKRSEMREFGKTYDKIGEIYIKLRVELLNLSGYLGHTTFVMSFHFAEKPFDTRTFPYCA